MRAKTVLTGAIMLLLLLSIAGTALQQNIKGNIDVVIKGYDDGVIVDAYVNLTTTYNNTVDNKGQLKLTIDAKTDMPSENKLVTDGKIDLTVIADAIRENKVNANIWLTYKSIKDYGELYLKAIGNYTNINGTLDFDVELKSEGNTNNTTVDLTANITIPVDMIGKDALNQLVMMSAFLTARTVNIYLEQLNMTFIRFKTLQITTSVDKQKNLVYINAKALFYVNGTEALLYREKYGTTPMIGVNTTANQSVIPPIQSPLNPSRETNTSTELEATIKTIDNQLKLNAVFHSETEGDLEKAAEEAHKGLLKIVKESNASLPPGLDEIYLVPGPGRFSLVVDATKPEQVNINLIVEGLRFKHVNLTGGVAQSRTAAIILGYLSAIQSYLPSTIDMNVKIVDLAKTEPDARIKEEVSNYLGSFMQGLPLPLPIQHTSTATITTSYITNTTPTTTSSTTSTTTTIHQTTSSAATSSQSPVQTSTSTPTTTTTTAISTTTTPATSNTTTPTSTSPSTAVTTTAGGGEPWTWIAVATIVIVAVVLVLLHFVLKKR